MRHTVLVPLALAGLAACRRNESPQAAAARMEREAGPAKAAITAQNAKWTRYAESGALDSIVALHADGAVLLPPNMPPVVGHDGIRNFWKTASQGYSMKIPLTTEVVVVNGPLAIERGTYVADVTPADPKAPKMVGEKGKYLSHWHLTNGQWLLVEQAWNSDAPPPAPPPPPPPPARRRR